MPILQDITGNIFGKLTVIEFFERTSTKSTMWVCLCECGTEKVINGAHLKSGKIISCGCYQKSWAITHGHTSERNHSPEYKCWNSMKSRCNNKKNDRYYDYGGRGISVCDQWNNSFETFLKDMGPRPSLKYSLERIDNDKNYTPDNCVWRTMQQQSRNKRSNRLLEKNGLKMVIVDWAKRWGIAYQVIQQSIKRHGSFDYIYTRHEINKIKQTNRLEK